MAQQPPAVHHAGFHGRIGVARREITPPVGIYARCWAAARHDVAEGVHRPLTLTALALATAEDPTPHVLITLDACSWGAPEAEWGVRGEVIRRLGVDPARVIVALAHTHSGGPAFLSPSMDGFPGGEHAETFYHGIVQAAGEAAVAARDASIPATLEWEYGRCALAANRDLPLPAGYVCGYNPGIAADDTLLVGRVTDAEGRILATLVNYACHPTTLAWDNRLISPDFPGALRETVEGATAGVPCLYLQGNMGDLAPREQYQGDPALADRHGRRLGYAVLSVLEGMLPAASRLEYQGAQRSGTALGVWAAVPHVHPGDLASLTFDLDLPLKDDFPRDEELERLQATTDDRVEAEKLRRKRTVRRWIGNGVSARLSGWVWRLGDALLVGLPTEPYSQLQVELRRRFPRHPVCALSLANGSIGYQPTAAMYGTDVYQVWQTPLARGNLELTLEECSRRFQELLEGEPARAETARGGSAGF